MLGHDTESDRVSATVVAAGIPHDRRSAWFATLSRKAGEKGYFSFGDRDKGTIHGQLAAPPQGTGPSRVTGHFQRHDPIFGGNTGVFDFDLEE